MMSVSRSADAAALPMSSDAPRDRLRARSTTSPGGSYPGERGRVQPRGAHVVAVADVRYARAVEAAERLAHREAVGQHLAGMLAVGEGVDHRRHRGCRDRLEVLVGHEAGDDAVGVAIED